MITIIFGGYIFLCITLYNSNFQYLKIKQLWIYEIRLTVLFYFISVFQNKHCTQIVPELTLILLIIQTLWALIRQFDRKGAVWSVSILFAIYATENIDSRREQMTDIAVNSKKRVKRVPLPPDKCVSLKNTYLLSKKKYVVGTQKNHLNETFKMIIKETDSSALKYFAYIVLVKCRWNIPTWPNVCWLGCKVSFNS